MHNDPALFSPASSSDDSSLLQLNLYFCSFFFNKAVLGLIAQNVSFQNYVMCLFWRRRRPEPETDPGNLFEHFIDVILFPKFSQCSLDYAFIETKFQDEPIYQKVAPRPSTRTLDDPLPIPSKCSVQSSNVFLKTSF